MKFGRTISVANVISILLLVYYLGGFFVFVLMNSHWHVEYKPREDGTKPNFSTTLAQRFNVPVESIQEEPELDLSFLIDKVSDFSIKECNRVNKKYDTSFDCATTPYSGLHVPYDKLPLGEKIEATLADFFKVVAGLFGRDFWSFRGIHVFLALCALAPLVVLAGVPLLWRLARWALRRAKDPAPAQPHYRVVLGVFAGVMALLVVAVVLVAMQERPTTQTALSDGRVESYKTTVNNLLN